jgi:hypothetical protein
MLTSITFQLDLLGQRGTKSNAKLELDAIGVRLVLELMELDTPLDISDATTITHCFRAPSQADKTFAATFLTDGTDGKIYYDLATGDLDEIGGWKISAQVIGPTYNRKSPSFGIFNVIAPICP